jgi:LacI family transcriptional regulator
MLSQRQVDGYIITPTLNLAEDIRRLQAENKPVVLIDRYFPGYTDIPSVLVDNYEGVTSGMEFLLEKGYRKIALVTIEVEMAHMQDRLHAYYDALENHSIPVDESLVKLIPYSSDKETALESISEFLSGNREKIDAVFFLTNYLGVLGIEATKNVGITIPGEMGMLCFDDNDIFRLYNPTISVIKQPIAEIGQKAMLSLIDRLKQGTVEEHPEFTSIRLASELIHRESI